jgi:hypothetical protein
MGKYQRSPNGPGVAEIWVYSLLFFHFVLTWALKTDALCLPNYLDSFDTFPSKSKMYREQIVKLCHDPPLAGHQGIERTIEKVKSRYYWRGISKDVSAYVKGSSALWEGKGMHSTHLVNWSTIIKMCSFPLSVRGRGPMKSKWTRSIGDPE